MTLYIIPHSLTFYVQRYTALIRRYWHFCEYIPNQGFVDLKVHADVVGVMGECAQGHFQHAGLIVNERQRSLMVGHLGREGDGMLQL